MCEFNCTASHVMLCFIIIELFCILGYDRIDEIQQPTNSVKKHHAVYASDSAKIKEECKWGNYARGALYALQSRGNILTEVKIFLCCYFMNHLFALSYGLSKISFYCP